MPILNLFQLPTPPSPSCRENADIVHAVAGPYTVALTMSTYFAYISIYIYRRIYHSQPLQCKNSKLDFELMNFFNSTLGHPWQLVSFASQSLSCTVKFVKLKNQGKNSHISDKTGAAPDYVILLAQPPRQDDVILQPKTGWLAAGPSMLSFHVTQRQSVAGQVILSSQTSQHIASLARPGRPGCVFHPVEDNHQLAWFQNPSRWTLDSIRLWQVGSCYPLSIRG